MQALLAAKPDVNIQNKFGSTALIIAAQYNKPEAVGAILLAKPDVNLQTNVGWTALMRAARYSQLEVVQDKPHLQMSDGGPALISAVEHGPTTPLR